MADIEVEVNVLADKTDKAWFRGKPGSSDSMDREYDPEAFVFASDAVNEVLTSYYLIDPDPVKNPTDMIGTVGSVWGNDPSRLYISSKLKSSVGRAIMKILSLLILLASMFEQPRIWPQVPYAVGWSIVAVILVVFWIVFSIKMWCMLPTKSEHWFKGAQDEVWTIALGVCLLMSTLGLILEVAEVEVEECDTIHQSNVKFNRAALWLRISRIYYIPYFAPTMRDGIVASLLILKGLVEIFGLIIVFFLCHYFAYDAAMDHDEVCTTSAGVTSCTSEWKQNLGSDSGDAKDGIWNMFILLTTANHPDIVMNFYDASPASFLMLVSFMLLTFYFLMNLLLGEVFTQYEKLFIMQIKAHKKLQAALINTCYYLVEDKDPNTKERGVRKAAFEQIIDHSKPPESSKDQQIMKDIWFAMLDDDGSGFIERDEFQKFEQVRDAPLRPKDEDEVSSKEHALQEKKALKKHELDMDKFEMRQEAVEKAQKELEEAEEKLEEEQAPVFEGLNCFFVTGTLADARPKNEPTARKVGDKGWRATPAVKNSFLEYVTWCNFVDALTALSIGYMAFSDAEDTCDETWALSIEISITTVFILDVVFRIFAEMKGNNKLAFFNTSFFNYIDMVAAIIMFVNVMLCTGSGTSEAARSAVAIVRVFRCLRLAHSIKRLRLMLKVARQTLVLTAPQFLLFLIVYYGFGILGMALFAGDTTKLTSQGGPGDWSTAPWASTSYGSTAYYNSLNFDNIGRSFFTLFTLMVQNNWSVTADGFKQTNDRWSRIYFFVFNIISVMLMINIFVATVIYFFSKLIKNEESEQKEEELKKEGVVVTGKNRSLAQKLLEDMVQRLDNVPMKITENKWYIKMKIEDAADIMDEEEDEENTAEKQTRAMLDHFPLGICIQEADGKYTWANREYKKITVTNEKRRISDKDTKESEAFKEALAGSKTGQGIDEIDEQGNQIILAHKYDAVTGMQDKAIKSREKERQGLIDKWRSKRLWANSHEDYDQTQEIWEDFDLEVYHSEEHGGKRYDAVSRPIQLLNKDIQDLQETETRPNSSVTGVVTYLMDQQGGQCKTLQFMKLDVDQDEKISLKEWTKKFGEESAVHFHKYDTDGDGFVTKADWDRRANMRINKVEERSADGNQSGAGEVEAAEASREHASQLRAVAAEKAKASKEEGAATKEEGHEAMSMEQFEEKYGQSNVGQYKRLKAKNDGIFLQQHANEFSKEWMRQVFDRVDRDHSNQIDAKELLDLFNMFIESSADLDDTSGGESALELTMSMVREFGNTADGNGQLNFDEFYKMLIDQGLFETLVHLSETKPELAYKEPVLSIQQLKYELQKLFDKMDESANNFIESNELYKYFDEHLAKWSSTDIKALEGSFVNPGKEMCRTLVDTFGQERPGALKFEEFARMMVEGNLWPYFGLKPAPMGCTSFSCTNCQGENCEFCLKNCAHENCGFSRLWKINRYKPGSAINPFNNLHWFRKTQAALMVRDATHNMNGIYFISAEGEAGGVTSWLNQVQCAASIWSDEPAAVKWASTLRSAYYCTLFRIVASLLMISTAFEEPKMWSEVPTAVGIGISISCTLVIWCVFFIYMRCMWPCKQFWYKGSTEEYWVLGLGVMLPLCTLGILLDASQEYQSSIDTIFGEVRIDRFAMVLKVTRIYFVLFFSPTMRAGFLSAYKVWGKLYEVFALIVISFVMHYFLFVAIMSDDQYQKNIGMNEGKYKDGLWNFFVTLTTANHPDIVMQLYDHHQLSGFVLVSFMVFTQYFLMSLLLGAVSDAYGQIYSESIGKDKENEKIILQTAFDMVKVCKCCKQSPCAKNNSMPIDGGVDFETFSEIVSLYGDGKGDDKDMIQVWFDMMDRESGNRDEAGEGTIDLDEFKDLKMILNAPIVRKENVGKQKLGPMFPFFHTFALMGRLSGLCSCCSPAFKEGDQVAAVYDYVNGKWHQASDPRKADKFLNEDHKVCTCGKEDELNKPVLCVRHAVVEKVEEETTELDAWVHNLPMEEMRCQQVAKIFKDKGWERRSDIKETAAEETNAKDKVFQLKQEMSFTLASENEKIKQLRDQLKESQAELKAKEDDSTEEKALEALRASEALRVQSETCASHVVTIVRKAFAHHIPAYPGPYYTVRYADESKGLSKSSVNLRGSAYSQTNLLSYIGWTAFVDFVTIFSVLWTLFIPADDVCDTDHGLTLEIIFTCVFIIDVIVSSLGHAYNGRPFAYYESKFQWLDIVSTIGMLVSVCLCAGDGSRQLRKVVGMVRVLRCFRLTYSLDNLKVICECALAVGAGISPQLIMFVIQYFAFAVIGMACFAGDVTKSTAAGGPGFWTASPYSSTAFGSTAYYYRLNFDNIGNSFATLFTQMVMNNWAVTVNGYEETNEAGRWVRIYFFIFHIFTVWLSINILIGTIMSAYGRAYEKAMSGTSGDEKMDNLEALLLAADDGSHIRQWEIFRNAAGDNRSLFEADETDADKRLQLEQLKQETMQRGQTRYIIKNCPIPTYITTSGGKYTLVNDAYNLLGTESRKFADESGHMKAYPDLTGRVEPEILYNGKPNDKRKQRQQAREEVLEKEPPALEYKHDETFVLIPHTKKRPVCWNCGNEGHASRECKQHNDGSNKFKPGQTSSQIKEYKEYMTAFTRPIQTAKGQPGCLTYFMSDDNKNQEQYDEEQL